MHIVFDPLEWNVYKIPNKPQEFIVQKIDENTWRLRQKRLPYNGLAPYNLPQEYRKEGISIICKVKHIEVSGSGDWPTFAEIDWCRP